MDNFDLLAKDYDTPRRTERARLIADKIRTYIVDGSEKTALEYGCGTGLVGLQLTDDFATMLLVDSSPAMIEQVKQKLSKLNKPSAAALCCDFTAATPRDMHFDYVFSSLVLHHIADTETIISRLYDALSPGGHLLIVDLEADNGSFHAKYPDFAGHHGFDKPLFSKLVKKAGFTEVETETFYHDVKIIEGKEAPYSLFILDATKGLACHDGDKC